MPFFSDLSMHILRSSWFIPELILADLIYWNPFDRKRLFPLRFIGFLLLLIVSLSFLFYITRGSMWNNILSFIVALLLSIVMGKFCFDIDWLDAAFCATVGYSTQFTGSIVSEFCQRALGVQRWPFEIGMILVVYAILYFIFGKRLQKGQNLSIQRGLQFFLLTSAAGIEIIICGILRSFWLNPEHHIYMICSMILLFLCSIGILSLQFSLLQGKLIANELEVVTAMMEKERTQYRFNKDTIDTLNRKCHDMRHQIRTIGHQEKLSPEAIREMTDAINLYDNLYKTGSVPLDTILAEWAPYCQENKISVNCMADGERLSFMRDTDVYSLFGNLLENAVHAVMELSTEDRDIFLSVVVKDAFLSIHQRNAYKGLITMKDGLPVTSATDPQGHGFGTRSIRVIVEQYGGTVSFVPKNGEFSVMILFPLTAQKN